MVARDLTPDDLREIDDDALANLARWRHDEHHRLWQAWLAERDRYDATVAEQRRRAAERNRVAAVARSLESHREFHASCEARGIIPQCQNCPLDDDRGASPTNPGKGN